MREEYSWAGNKYLGPKIGFDVVTMDGRRGKLARIDMYELSYLECCMPRNVIVEDKNRVTYMDGRYIDLVLIFLAIIHVAHTL